MRISMTVIFAFIIISCGRKEKAVRTDREINERLTEMNRGLVREEAERIEEFIRRHSLKVQMTGTGLRYAITGEGSGAVPGMHDEVTINYRRFLLDGTFIDSLSLTEPLVFRLGRNLQPRGLEEVIMMMKAGQEAKAVIPSHLAFGMTGENDVVPPAASLYYELKLLNVNNEK